MADSKSGVGRGWFGRLPGDIHYTRGNFSFRFPVVTCLLLSVVLTILLRIFRRSEYASTNSLIGQQLNGPAVGWSADQLQRVIMPAVHEPFFAIDL